MIDGPETVQLALTCIMLQTKTDIKQVYTERSLTKMDARSTDYMYRGKTKEQPTEYIGHWASKKILDNFRKDERSFRNLKRIYRVHVYTEL